MVFALLLFNNRLKSQNLIQNGSFEFNIDSLLNYSKDNMSGLDGFVKYENTPSNQFIGSTIPPWLSFNSADYFNNNSLFTTSGYVFGTWTTYNTLGIPENLFGYSYAQDSNYYAGFYSFKGNNSPTYFDYKEYIYQQLDMPLQSNETYCLSFWVKLSSGSNYAIKQIGAFFSSTLPSISSTYYINASPQVVNNATFITDTLNWTLIHGCFTAQGGEQYITIGNFNNNVNTNTLNVGNKNYLICCDPTAYYYIDNVSLFANNAATNIYDNNSDFANINIYPNPAKDILYIKTLIDKNLIVSIKDIVGKEVVKAKDQKEIDVSALEKGIYFIDIFQNKQKIITKKIIKD